MVTILIYKSKLQIPRWLTFLLLSLIGSSSLFGQYYFGRNKIQYEQFDWQVLSTAHFNLYYYPEEEQLVQLAAAITEETYSELEQKCNFTMITPIPLIIYSNHIHFQQTNVLQYSIPEGIGGFFEFIKKRVVVPYTGKIEEFRHVIRHELVHVFTYNKIGSINNQLGSWETPDFPLWFMEGIAEYWSEGWDSDSELIIRDAVLHDYLYPLDSYELMQTGYLLYKEGQSFLRFYEEHYGTDRIRLLMTEFWRYDSFEEAFAAISGKEFELVEAEWRLDLKQSRATDLAAETVLKPGEYQVTKQGINICPEVYSDSSGEQLIHLSNRYGYTDIYRHNLNRNKEKILFRGERKADFESLHLLQTGFNINHRSQLVFVTKSGAQDVLQILDLETRKIINTMQQSELVTIHSPKWSSDNTRIVFAAQNQAGFSDLYIWEISQPQLIKLTNDIFTDSAPCFSPDGNWIVFESDRNSNSHPVGSNLFLLELTSGEILQLTNNHYYNTKPVWSSRDPTLIYFLSDVSGTMNLWTVTLESSSKSAENIKVSLRQLTNYHTGLWDANPTRNDTLFASVFMKYNYQIHALPLYTDTAYQTISLPAQKVKPAKYEIPAIASLSRPTTRPYKLKYSLDIAQTAVAYDPIFGFLGGAQLGISDLLGNRYYHFLVANTAQTSGEIIDRFNVAVTMVDLTRRSNHALGFFHFANDYYDPYQDFYFERSIGFRGALNFPIDIFRRLEFSMSLWSSIKDNYFGKVTHSYLLSNYFSFVHDNSIWTYIGPIDGWRFRFTIGPTFNFLNSSLHNYTILCDFRYYWRLNPQITFAQRVIYWLNRGTDIRRFYIGGSWGLRGYRIYEIYGNQYFLFNNELRLPFAESIMIHFKKTGVGFAPVRSAVFWDIGNAWENSYPGLIGSLGVGLRGNLFGGLVLRLDIGKRTDFKSFQKGLFCQFFFGWDY